VAKFLGLDNIEIEFVFVSQFTKSSVSLQEEEQEEQEEQEEELKEDDELLLFFMLSSLAFKDLLCTLAVCLEKSQEGESEEDLSMTIGLWRSSSIGLLLTGMVSCKGLEMAAPNAWFLVNASPCLFSESLPRGCGITLGGDPVDWRESAGEFRTACRARASRSSAILS
jgi:hypothetical protein